MDPFPNGWAEIDRDFVIVNTRGTATLNHNALIPRAEWERASVDERRALVQAQIAESQAEQDSLRFTDGVLASGFSLITRPEWRAMPPLDDAEVPVLERAAHADEDDEGPTAT